MKKNTSYLAMFQDGSVDLIWHNGDRIYYDWGFIEPCEEEIQILFDAEDAMQFLIDCEWEGKIESVPLEEE